MDWCRKRFAFQPAVEQLAVGALEQAADRSGQFEKLRRDLSVQSPLVVHRREKADRDHHDGATIDLAAAEHAVRRRQVCQLALRVIFGHTGDRADLVKTLMIEQTVDTLANGEPALVTLALDLVNAAHLARERFAPGEVVEFRLPVHSDPPS